MGIALNVRSESLDNLAAVDSNFSKPNYGNGPYYALSVEEKWIDFKLQVDSDTDRKAVRVEQNGITVIDPEFQGTYFREP